MDLETIMDIYALISRGTENLVSRKKCIQLRKASASNDNGFTKLAFDTRRIDQETEYNPRRGLQNYNRSEAFLSESLSNKLHSLSNLRSMLVDLKTAYGKEPEWQDSNARVLLSTLDKGLRVDQKDGDFSENQPAMGSLNYIEDLLHVRYRLTMDDLSKMAAKDIKRVILSKDEYLTKKDSDLPVEIKKSDIGRENYDALMDKLFGGVKATKDNPEVERTITITIKDRLIDK